MSWPGRLGVERGRKSVERSRFRLLPEVLSQSHGVDEVDRREFQILESAHFSRDEFEVERHVVSHDKSRFD